MSDGRKRLLVLGGTGMLGHETVRMLSHDFTVHATVRDGASCRAEALGVPLHEFDAAGPEILSEVLAAAEPDVVLNCIGLVKQVEAASDPLAAIAVNSMLPHQVAKACAERSVRLIHVSTDCVFSGELPAGRLYAESDRPDPVDLYGRSKLLGEVVRPGALTIRTSIIGWELGRVTGLLEWAVSQREQRVSGFVNAWFSGLTTTALAHTMGIVVRDFPELHGLYHVAADPISKYDLLQRLNDVLKLGLEIEPAVNPRINRGLDASRFRAATGLAPPSWDQLLAALPREGVHGA